MLTKNERHFALPAVAFIIPISDAGGGLEDIFGWKGILKVGMRLIFDFREFL